MRDNEQILRAVRLLEQPIKRVHEAAHAVIDVDVRLAVREPIEESTVLSPRLPVACRLQHPRQISRVLFAQTRILIVKLGLPPDLRKNARLRLHRPQIRRDVDAESPVSNQLGDLPTDDSRLIASLLTSEIL